MVAEMFNSKNLNPIVTELFIRRRKLNIFLILITEYFFAISKNIRLNLTNCFVMKIPSKREFQQIPFNHSSDTDFQNFMHFYEKCAGKMIQCSRFICIISFSDHRSVLTTNLFHTKSLPNSLGHKPIKSNT